MNLVLAVSSSRETFTRETRAECRMPMARLSELVGDQNKFKNNNRLLLISKKQCPALAKPQCYKERFKIKHFEFLFAKCRLHSESVAAVMLADTILDEEVYSSKFLGIYFDRGLTSNDHIDYVCAKLASGIFIFWGT